MNLTGMHVNTLCDPETITLFVLHKRNGRPYRVTKIQIGSNIIFLMGMKIIHICNFLTMKLCEKLQEHFFAQNQFQS